NELRIDGHLDLVDVVRPVAIGRVAVRTGAQLAVRSGYAAARGILRRTIGDVVFGLTVRARDAALEVVHDADARLALKRAALDVDFLQSEAVEILLVLVLGSAGVADATAFAAERAICGEC